MSILNWGAFVLLRAAQTGPDSDSSEVWSGWGSVIMAVTVVTLILAIVALLIWQGMKMAQVRLVTRETLARDEEYRKLAEEATAAQRKSAEEQQKTAEVLTDVRARVTAIETLLRQVE